MSVNTIKEIIVRKNAINDIPEILDNLNSLEDHKKIYLIVDNNTYLAAGERVATLLTEAGYDVNKVFLVGDKIIANTDYLFKLMNSISRDGYLLACGSGTINDLTRYISFKLEIPYTIVATAPSMDGYASPVSPITVDGVKTTYNAVTAESIVGDIDVLRNAPWEMIQAGYGDLLGKISALTDWKLSNILFGDELNQQAISLVEDELITLIELTPELKDRTEESIKVLMKGLVNSGVAMQIVGNSRPASGTEHHISHFLEMYGEIFEEHLPPHGIKVALGEYFAAQLYMRLYELDFSNLENVDNLEERKKRIRTNYLDRAQPVLDTLDERWEGHQLNIDLLKEKEKEIKTLIEEYLLYFKGINKYLEQAGIFEREDVRSIKREWLLKAVQTAFEIRNRYTVAALLYQVGLLEEWSFEIVDEFLELTKGK